MKTDQEVVEKTEEVARFLLLERFNLEPETPNALLRHSKNIKAQWAWKAACTVQEILNDTDVSSAVAEVDDA